MLELRLAEGLSASELSAVELQRADRFLTTGLLELVGGQLRLTPEGRLLADAVIRELL